MACSTAKAQEYFTTNGTTPAPPPSARGTNIPQQAGSTAGFTARNSPVAVNVIAFKTGLSNSNVTSGTYIIHPSADPRSQIPDPQIGPAAGNYKLDASQTQMSFIIATAIPGAAMRYSLDGTTPTPTYGNLINKNVGRVDLVLPASQSSQAFTLKVIAFGLGKTPSNVSTFSILLQR
jgi:hypothetical protein